MRSLKSARQNRFHAPACVTAAAATERRAETWAALARARDFFFWQLKYFYAFGDHLLFDQAESSRKRLNYVWVSFGNACTTFLA